MCPLKLLVNIFPVRSLLRTDPSITPPILSLAPRRYNVLLFRALGIQPSNRLLAVVIIGTLVPIRTIPSYKLLVAR